MHKFYISNKKYLSNRYSTDCLSDPLAVRALRTAWGLDDSPSFPNNKATVEDFKKMNSYFFDGVIEEFDSQIEGKADKQEEENPVFAAFVQDCIERYEADSSVIEKIVQKQCEKTLSKQIERYTNGH